MMHMYVWSRKPTFIAVAQAPSIEEARRALLSEDELGESGDGSCPERDEARKVVLETHPNIWHGTNAEFALTDSAELREYRDWSRKQIDGLKRQLAEETSKRIGAEHAVADAISTLATRTAELAAMLSKRQEAEAELAEARKTFLLSNAIQLSEVMKAATRAKKAKVALAEARKERCTCTNEQIAAIPWGAAVGAAVENGDCPRCFKPISK